MIELIFVIIILGILASIAMTKIMATRDDAQVSKEAYDLSVVVEDISAFYTANGYFSTPREMTNVVFENSADTNLTTDILNFNDCISISSIGYNSSQKNAITISYASASADDFCAAVANAAQNITDFVDKNSNSSKMFVVGGSKIY